MRRLENWAGRKHMKTGIQTFPDSFGTAPVAAFWRGGMFLIDIFQNNTGMHIPHSDYRPQRQIGSVPNALWRNRAEFVYMEYGIVDWDELLFNVFRYKREYYLLP